MPQNENIAIHTTDITKHFGNKKVLDGINMNVPAGSIYGISGANGAGKSVLLRILCGWIIPDGGFIEILGEKIGVDTDFPPETGALVDMPGFLTQYSGYRNLEILARINNKIRSTDIAEAMHLVGLSPDDNAPVKTYSNGMRQRLGIAQAIMEKPRVLILDEPTDAIDQAGWKEIYQHLIRMKEEGTAILLSSNKLDEIAILCDAAFVLEYGHLKEISPNELKETLF
jgi:ABC-2 type transport system ATP-binding protein